MDRASGQADGQAVASGRGDVAAQLPHQHISGREDWAWRIRLTFIVRPSVGLLKPKTPMPFAVSQRQPVLPDEESDGARHLADHFIARWR